MAISACPYCSEAEYLPNGMGHCPGCHESWTGFGVCHCAGCHLTFTSDHSFRFHLTGPVEDRHHLTPDELRDKGYEPNDKGQWREPLREPVARS